MSLFSRDGMLTGTEIERRVKKGHIQITPYDPKCVNPNSYNLKLHPQLLIYKRDAERANIITQNLSIDQIVKFRDCKPGSIAYGTAIKAAATHISYQEYKDNDENIREYKPVKEETNVKHDMACGPEGPTIEAANLNSGRIEIVNTAVVITDKFKELESEIDGKTSALETKWRGAFNQLGGTVEYNDRKSRERDEEIKSLPIVESNYLPPLDMHKKNETIEFQIPEEGYVLQPGVLYIGRTVERTATDRFIPMINGRSSGGRLGISIHICAGFGDIGFDGTWTLEITVVEPVRIYPNEEIAQVCFFTPAGKKAKLYRGRYYKQEEATASRFYQPKKEY